MLRSDATKSGWQIIGLSVLCGALVWILDAVADFLLFYGGNSTFLDVLILASPSHEIFMRPITALVFAGFALLVLKRCQMKRELQASAERHQDLYDNAPVMYVSADPATVRIIRCNQPLTQPTGHGKQEIVGMPIFDRYHPDCMEAAKAAFDFLSAEAQWKTEDL